MASCLEEYRVSVGDGTPEDSSVWEGGSMLRGNPGCKQKMAADRAVESYRTMHCVNRSWLAELMDAGSSRSARIDQGEATAGAREFARPRRAGMMSSPTSSCGMESPAGKWDGDLCAWPR